MDSFGQGDDFDLQIEAMEDNLGHAAGMAAAFNAEMARMRETFAGTGQDVATLERGISRGLNSAIRGAVVEGDSLSEALRTLAQSMINASFNVAMRPVTDHVGGLVAQGVGALVDGILPFEKGAGFALGRVMPFARGAVISGPTTFPMRRGLGLMGEAGPEAIMPLTRGSDGKLGVRAEGGGRPVSVVMNVHTPDAEGFRRSRGQVAAELSRAIARGNRNR
ncbi:phage tail tape measure protein [Roseovarius amoyensis]|uniref:phage tail tape measure protein n=1 Tax=Roseovarius amoyensis TaxID=2211448 RepID=UPI000DBE12C8|nr:phage tail tape measure protein [Roseovarius amoyensis]